MSRNCRRTDFEESDHDEFRKKALALCELERRGTTMQIG